MASNSEQFTTYKGLAVFTPSGDLVYCIDPTKTGHWHVQLCTTLQQILSLPECPLLLSRYYTATVDRWIDRQTQQLTIAAAAQARVWRYRSILSVIFAVPLAQWSLKEDPDEDCAPELLAAYQAQFPELWKYHHLVLWQDLAPSFQQQKSPELAPPFSGHVFRLFVGGRSQATIQALETVHQFLEKALQQPYTLRIIDVEQHPELAEENLITATPTLVKVWPPPVRKLVGRLVQPERVLSLLDTDFHLSI